MKDLYKNVRSRLRGPIAILLVFWIVYVVVSLLAPTIDTQSRYGLTAVQANILKITVYLPYLFIWLGALLAVLSFKAYLPLVENSPESKGFRRFYVGLACLGLAVVIPTLISLLRSFYPHSEPIVKTVTILNNYIYIILYLGAFWNILQGSRDLFKTLKLTSSDGRTSTTVVVIVALLSAAYVWSVFHNPIRTASADPDLRPTYYVSDLWIFITIIIPNILIWAWGGLAITNILAYAKEVPGQLYRQAFTAIARGLTVIIGLSIVVQFLPPAARYFLRANLGIILLIIYLLLIVIAVGYIWVAKGSSKLTAIEKV